eukprot:CAMPEP_0182904622 /NCGR_PEP_ID=MMETSP0034_2-20130328/32245_1 /TAXON_ID=156128 /ORGANISM="Nephroselmis pyriformis, Strain CCMP717" /LENGTH=235 /DNA_ID=CAMNT_0025039811 /DNA_START=234 /DNA_END=942 /DNA_ORIENTATION=-
MPQAGVSPVRSAPRRTPGRPTAPARGVIPAATTPARHSALVVVSAAKSSDAKRKAQKPKAVKQELKLLYPDASATYPKRDAGKPSTVTYWDGLEGITCTSRSTLYFAGGKELYEAVRDRVGRLRREAKAEAKARAEATASPSRARGRAGVATRSLTRAASRSPEGAASRTKRAKQPQRALDFAQAPAPAAPVIPEEEITGLLAEVGALAGEAQGTSATPVVGAGGRRGRWVCRGG